MTMRLLVAIPALALLGACGRQSEEAKAPRARPAPTQQAAPSSPAQPTPPPAAASANAQTRQVGSPQVNITSAAPPPPPPPVEALASGKFRTQASWNLTKAKVTGAILSVEFQIEGKSCENEYIELKEVSYIDEASAKKFTVLKDEGSQWMAGPLSGSDRVHAKACGGASQMWIKFPAPPAETKTITLNLSQLGTLDGIPVQR